MDGDGPAIVINNPAPATEGQSGTINVVHHHTVGVQPASGVVAVKGDTFIEGNEAFLVSLSNPTNGNIADNVGAVFIVDDDGPGLLEDEPSE